MEWLIYLLKVSVCMGLFYGCYHLFLQRLTFFNFNRLYLISTLIISFVIPAMHLQIEQRVAEPVIVKEDSSTPYITYPELQNPALSNADAPQQSVHWSDSLKWEEIIYGCYRLVAGVLFAIFVAQSFQLVKHTRKVNLKVGRLRIIFKDKGFSNCSFLNYVFINPQELSEEEMNVILKHEQVHVSRYHSADKVLISALKALLWFNPIVYLYDKALEQVHEYEADKETSLLVGDTSYANLLLAIAIRKNSPSLVHSFVSNPMKGRMKMLFTSQSKNMKKLMYLAVVPLGLVLTWAFAVQIVYASLPVETPKKKTFKAIPSEKAPKTAVIPKKKKREKLVSSVIPTSDTLWMVSSRNVNRYSEAIIDGKSYGIDILTKISPSCIKSIKYGRGKIEITTENNEITYATKTDRENAMARDKARAANKHYIRYTQKSEDGSRSEYVELYTKNGSGGSLGIDKGKKLLLIYEGKQYTERQFKALTEEQLVHRPMSFSGGLSEEIKAKYGKNYDSMIQVFKSKDTDSLDTVLFKPKSAKTKIFRRPIGFEVDDAYGKFSYFAQDSTIYSNGLADVMLYGKVNMKNDQLTINADQIKFNHTDHIALAKNVRFTKKGKPEIKDTPFVKFDLRAGTYQVMQKLKDF